MASSKKTSKSVACRIRCGKRFGRKQEEVRHFKDLHKYGDSKKYFCRICHHGTNRLDKMMEHEAIHSELVQEPINPAGQQILLNVPEDFGEYAQESQGNFQSKSGICTAPGNSIPTMTTTMRSQAIFSVGSPYQNFPSAEAFGTQEAMLYPSMHAINSIALPNSMEDASEVVGGETNRQAEWGLPTIPQRERNFENFENFESYNHQ